MSRSFVIGWDVGGWNCDKNSSSRDALVILDKNLQIVGTPWRGNLRESINAASTCREWTTRLFGLCESEPPANPSLTLAIDTPLGFPTAFLSLAAGLLSAGSIGDSPVNPYLYRHTERVLFRGKRGPLSAIKDMIGSQATKGMHVLAKFAPRVERCGVWSDGAALRVIETYPAACRRAEADYSALAALEPLAHNDLVDARVCALVAYLFATTQDTFEEPPEDVPAGEGWIWVPKKGKIQELLAMRAQPVNTEGG
jgi:hypothetical protein